MIIDKKVILRLKAKDEDAFNLIYYEYVNLVFHVIYRIVENKDDAEDLTQDTLIQLMTSIESFNENNNFKYWLLQIAKNKAFNHVKSKQLILANDHIGRMIDNNSNDSTSDFDEMMNQYRDIINKDEFDVITLRIFHNFKFKEIADLYGKTESSINNIYHRGISKIKKKGLKKYEKEN